MALSVDISEFQAAMKDAIRTSSRSAATVINGKHQDLLYKAGNATEKTKWSVAQFNEYIRENPKYIAWRCNRKYGDGNWTIAEYKEMWKATRKMRLGAGFMRSGFILAGKKMKRVNQARAGKVSAKQEPTSGRPIRAIIQEAAGTGRMQVSGAAVLWKAHPGGDSSKKEKILAESVRGGMAVVTADTKRHMAEKLAKDFAKLSAKGAR